MRSARLTFPGAWHHVMNHSLGNQLLFENERHMQEFLDLLNYAVRLYGVRLICYCLLPTHFHLLVQNVSGKLSDFMKYLNSTWAMRYRTKVGGRGYLFQSRFKSTLIQDDVHLETVLAYILLNPVRAGLVRSAWDYRFSSINSYYKKSSGRLDAGFVRDLFPAKKDLNRIISYWEGKELKPVATRIGPVLGSADFISKSLARYDKRTASVGTKRRRIEERNGRSMESVIIAFEKERRIKLEKIDTRTIEGKRLRTDLLVRLREKAGMSYPEIIKIPLFSGLKLSSLGSMIRIAKRTR